MKVMTPGRTAIVLAMLLWASAAPAQTVTSDQPSPPVARVEAGLGVSALAIIEEGALPPQVAMSTRVNLRPWIAVETTGDVAFADSAHRLNGVYGVQLHQTLERRGIVTPYVTYGGMGWLSYERMRGFRSTAPAGDTVVYPAFSEFRMGWPIMPAFGGGVRLALARGLSVEAGGRVLVLMPYPAMAVTAQIGVVVPIGRVR